MLSGRFIRMLYTEDEQVEKKAVVVVVVAGRDLLFLLCWRATSERLLLGYSHFPIIHRLAVFFAHAGGIVTAESRGSCRHHLLLPR